MRRFCTIFALLICFPALVRGDIIRLKNGAVLTGKIIQQSSADIVFASASATSTLQRESVAEIFKTSSPDEDQELLSKMGKDHFEERYRKGLHRRAAEARPFS